MSPDTYLYGPNPPFYAQISACIHAKTSIRDVLDSHFF